MSVNCVIIDHFFLLCFTRWHRITHHADTYFSVENVKNSLYSTYVIVDFKNFIDIFHVLNIESRLPFFDTLRLLYVFTFFVYPHCIMAAYDWQQIMTNSNIACVIPKIERVTNFSWRQFKIYTIKI